MPEALEDFHKLSGGKELCSCRSRGLQSSFLVIGGREYIASEILHVCLPDDFVGDGFCARHRSFRLLKGIEEGGKEDICLRIL